MSNSTIENLPVPTLHSRGLRRWVRLLFLMLIFLSGGVVGVVLGSYYTRYQMMAVIKHPEEVPYRVLRRLHAQLSLTPDQTKSLEEIITRRHSAMETIRAQSHPKQLAEFETMCNEIAQVLTPDQSKVWNHIRGSIQDNYLPSAPFGPPPVDLIFQNFDKNQDQAVSREEAPPQMWFRLSNADSNNDGKITREEYQNATAR